MTSHHRARQEQPARPASAQAPATARATPAHKAPGLTQAELRQIVLDIIG